MRTKEEKELLKKLASGALDGVVGNPLRSGKSMVWTIIKDGEPVRYKEGPGGKFFNGKENERYDGAIHILERWTTDERQLEFIRKYGWLMKDVDAKAYSAKFKPE